MTAIAARAFENADALEELVIPDSIASIGEYAFSDCTSLITIMIEKDGSIEGEKGTVLLPRALVSLGDYAFCDNKMMEKIVLRGSIGRLNNLFTRCGKLTNAVIELNGLKSIKGCFSDCDALTELRIPEGVERLDMYAIGASKAKIYLPSTIVNIGYCALNSSLIEYAGTVARWQDISKDKKWIGHSSDYTVICIDGRIN